MEEINQNPQTPPEPTPQPEVATPQTPTPIEPEKFSLKSFFKENKWAIWLLTGSILLIALAAYFVLRTPSSNEPSQPNVALSIEAPDQIASGSEVIYKVHVKNSDSAAIKNISLDMVYPNGFTYNDATPKPTKLTGTQFGLPTMEPGEETVLMIKGDIHGNAGEIKTISATMHYSFSNFNSTFVAQTQAQSQITSADLALQFDGPTQALNAQQETYTLNYANYTDKVITGLKISVTLPDGFQLTNADPKATSNNTWQIGDLNPNNSGRISLTGTFKNVKAGDQELFTAKAEGSVNGSSSYVLSTGQLQVNISSVPLEAVISYNPGPNDDQSSVSPGESVTYNIDYRNNGDSPARAVIITAVLNGEGYDLNRITASGANVNGNRITWDASQNSRLESLAAGDSGSLSFSVPVSRPATRGASKNMTLTTHTEIISSGLNQPYIGSDLALKIQTVVDVSSSVAFVSGANPAKVGQSTTYNVSITLKNETNDVVNGKMTMSLPSAIGFTTGSINADEKANVTYDSGTKKLTWTIDKLVAHAGSFTPPRKLTFNITANPGVNLRGASISLVTNQKFTATDSFTNLPISISPDAITSPDAVQ